MSPDLVAYPARSPRLLDQVRELIRYKHYSLRTEQAYLYWVKFFIRWQMRQGQMRHPKEMGAAEVTQFLSMLATERKVAVSTHNQALIGYSDVSTTMIYTHVLKVAVGGTANPLDALAALN